MDRLFDGVDAARAGIHPAQADQSRLVVVGDLVEQLGADIAVDHLLHMRGVAEQERQIEHVEIVDHRAERAARNAGELDGADLRLLDGFLLAAELHRRVHLHAEPPLGRGFKLFAEAFDRGDRRIACGVDIRRLERQLLLRHVLLSNGMSAEISSETGDGSAGAKTNECAAIHVSLLPRVSAAAEC